MFLVLGVKETFTVCSQLSFVGRMKVSLIDPFRGKESYGSERKWPLSCLTP